MINSGMDSNIELGIKLLKANKINIKNFIDTEYGNILKFYELPLTKKGLKLLSERDSIRVTNIFNPNIAICKKIVTIYLHNIKEELDLNFLTKHFKRLTTLSIENCNISDIPKDIDFLDIKFLYIDETKLGDISNITKLTNLQQLYILNSDIKEIPKNIGKLSYLKSLNFGGNQIKEIPESLFDLGRLENLKLENNKISNISDSIYKLTKLKQLNLLNNNIDKISHISNFLNKLQIKKLDDIKK